MNLNEVILRETHYRRGRWGCLSLRWEGTGKGDQERASVMEGKNQERMGRDKTELQKQEVPCADEDTWNWPWLCKVGLAAGLDENCFCWHSGENALMDWSEAMKEGRRQWLHMDILRRWPRQTFGWRYQVDHRRTVLVGVGSWKLVFGEVCLVWRHKFYLWRNRWRLFSVIASEKQARVKQTTDSRVK